MSSRRQIYAERSAQGAPAYAADRDVSEVIGELSNRIVMLEAQSALKDEEIIRLRDELAAGNQALPAPPKRRAAAAPPAA